MKDYEVSHGIPWSFILGSPYNHERILKNLLNTYKTRYKLANYLGVSFRGLSNKLEKEGIIFKKRISYAQKIRDLGNETKSMTTKEIAEHVGCSVKTVVRTCVTHNINRIKKYNFGKKVIKP